MRIEKAFRTIDWELGITYIAYQITTHFCLDVYNHFRAEDEMAQAGQAFRGATWGGIDGAVRCDDPG